MKSISSISSLQNSDTLKPDELRKSIIASSLIDGQASLSLSISSSVNGFLTIFSYLI